MSEASSAEKDAPGAYVKCKTGTQAVCTHEHCGYVPWSATYAEKDATALLIGGPFDRHRVRLSATPPRIDVGGLIYEQITDPDTGEFLGAYVLPPTRTDS